MMYDQWKYSQLHQQEMLRQSEQIRLAHQVMGNRRHFFNRTLVILGRLMVTAGQALHARYTPAKPPVPTYTRTPLPVVNRGMARWHADDNRCERESLEATRSQNRLFKLSGQHPRSHKKPNDAKSV